MQYATDDNIIELWHPWRSPIKETLQLMDFFAANTVVGFNLAFDWFHICQMYTTLQLCKDHNEPPDVTEYAYMESVARAGKCLKPAGCLDLMLHARKGPYQSTMDRSDVIIKRVPTALAYQLAQELDKRIPLKDIYFARKKANKKMRWQVDDIEDEFGDIIPEFKDLVLRFAPSSALKALAVDALGYDEETILTYGDVDVPEYYRPVEYGFAPFAMSGVLKEVNGKEILQPVSHENWRSKWPNFIEIHDAHWFHNRLAKRYATLDVEYTRGLYNYFEKPEPNDDDSVLACMVGAVRWRGFEIDKDKAEAERQKAVKLCDDTISTFNFNSPAVCKKYLAQVMSDAEQAILLNNDKFTTKKMVLEIVTNWMEAKIHDECNGFGCDKCDSGLVNTDIPHPASIRAQEILSARAAKKKIELIDKIMMAGRFHASFKVIGTLSSRMSGGDGLNPQGIIREDTIREIFTMAPKGMTLCGGDFDAFEVSIVDADYKDPVLHQELLEKKKIHCLFGVFFFPDQTYDSLLRSKGLPGPLDKYTRSKNGVFAILYFGNEHTLTTRVGIKVEQANDAIHRASQKYKVFFSERQKYSDMFCSMQQPKGIGTAVEWHEPADHIETMLGFKRYFTLENKICKELFKLAEKPPASWTQLKMKVTRRDRVQTAGGALRSALFAAAFAVQGSNMRAAGNHRIQGTGAQITKGLERRIWDLQPVGLSDWIVMPFNVHDEVLAPVKIGYEEQVKKIADDYITEFRPLIPFIGMNWGIGLESWAKKG
jgi:hypothetical protein